METFFSTITLHDLTPAQFAAVANALNAPGYHPAASSVPPVATAAATPASESKAAPAAPDKAPRGRKPKAKVGEPAAPTTPPSHDLPLSESPTSMEDVRKALSDLLAAKGMTECSQLLATFGATRIGELPVEKYAAVVAACKGAQA